jgi:type IX secretion system PorP/SprF family membrane protein
MKKYILALFFCTGSLLGAAQQTPLFSQYISNYYLLNPAMAGSEEDIMLKAGYRLQWVGFEGAPATYYLSGHTPFQKQPNGRGKRSRRGSRRPTGFHAGGGYVYGDNTGPISRTGLNLSYAYHIPLSREITTSVGLTAGMQQYLFDADKLNLADNSNDFDPVTMGGNRKSLVPDISLGYCIYSEQFYAGLSLAQALGNKIFAFEQSDLESTGKLYRHLFFSGGYTFAVNREFGIAPSTLVKYTSAAPLQADINVRAIYTFNDRRRNIPDDKAWLGISYRTQDALVALLGVQFLERYEVNYSYDLTLSPLKHHSAGSHEISLGLRLKR